MNLLCIAAGTAWPSKPDTSLAEHAVEPHLVQPVGWLGNSQQQRPLAEGLHSNITSPQSSPAAATDAAGVSSPRTAASDVALDIHPSSTGVDPQANRGSATSRYPLIRTLSKAVLGKSLGSTKHMLVSGSKKLFSFGKRGEEKKTFQGPQSPVSSGGMSRGSGTGHSGGPGSSIWGSAFAAAAAAAPSNDSMFCDYESAGVYDPNSGAFHAADRSKKPAVMEYRVQPISAGLGLDQAMNVSNMARKQSPMSGSGRVGRKHSGGSGRSSGSSSSWRAAAAAAAAAEAGPDVIPRTRSAPGSQIASKIAASKVLRKKSADSWNSDLSDSTAAAVADLERASTAPTAVEGHGMSSTVASAVARPRDRVRLGRAAGITDSGVPLYRRVTSTSSNGPAAPGSSSVVVRRSVTSSGCGNVEGAPDGPTGTGLNERLLGLHSRAAQSGATQQQVVMHDSLIEEDDETG